MRICCNLGTGNSCSFSDPEIEVSADVEPEDGQDLDKECKFDHEDAVEEEDISLHDEVRNCIVFFFSSKCKLIKYLNHSA